MLVKSSVISSEEIYDFLNHYRGQCSTEIIEGRDSNWIFDSGCLKHHNIDFFEIAAIRDPFDLRRLMITQREQALVGLLCVTVNGEDYVLVTARCEPGLHNTCQLTTTIQSTPSNYLRRHNGLATPLIEYFTSSIAGSKVLHDSVQSDWGDYYLGKRKRFQILEVDELLSVSGQQRWIRISDLENLLYEDFVITSDLRVACLLLHSVRTQTTLKCPKEFSDTNYEVRSKAYSVLDVCELQEYGSRFDIVDDYNRSTVFVRFSSTSREVVEWSQPLLAIGDDKIIKLWVDTNLDEPRFAVSRATQLGLQGIEQWFAATVNRSSQTADDSRIREVNTSAEGGRFYRHGVTLGLHRWNGETFDEPFEWWTRDELLTASVASMSLSLELRMMASLII